MATRLTLLPRLPRPAARRVVPLLTVLVLLASALIVVLALTGPDPQPPANLPGAAPGDYEPADLAGDGGPAIERMAEVLPVTLGYDYRALDEGLAEATALMTNRFARRFTRSFNSSTRPLAKRQETVASARVLGAGLVRLTDPDTVVGLAYVDQVLVKRATRKPGGPPEGITRSRVLVRLVQVDDTWLVANISPV